MKIPINFIQQYKAFLLHKNATEGVIPEFSEQVHDFMQAIEFLNVKFVDKTILEFTAAELVQMLRETHSIMARTLYRTIPHNNCIPGEFKKDLTMELKYYPNAHKYYQGTGTENVFGMTKFLRHTFHEEKYDIGLEFLAGYYKILWAQDFNEDQKNVFKRRATLDYLTKDMGQDEKDKYQQDIIAKIKNPNPPEEWSKAYKDISRKFDEELTESERCAVDKIFWLSDCKEIKNKLLDYFQALIEAVKNKSYDPHTIFAIFSYRFIQIRPFLKGNSAVMHIFLNAFTMELGLPPVFLGNIFPTRGELYHTYFHEQEEGRANLPELGEIIANFIEEEKNKEAFTSVEKVFKQVVSECGRSETKRDLHFEPRKDECLARLLRLTFKRYNEDVVTSFQREYEKNNPQLSYLFAQLVNAINEKAFHSGSCHSQAAYALVELFKNNIFTFTLVWSRTGNPCNEHYYLVQPDQNILKSAKEANAPLLRRIKRLGNKPNFGEKTLFFDSWSNQLCLWKNIEFTNDYTRAMGATDQALFEPFERVFGSESALLEQIVWCLSEYRMRLKQLRCDPFKLLAKEESLKNHEQDNSFNQEIAFLTNPKACLAKLLEVSKEYENQFKQQLAQKAKCSSKAILTDQQLIGSRVQRLYYKTLKHFSNDLELQWKTYPSNKLTGAYVGHDVRFFTVPANESQKAQDFNAYLKKCGFHTNLSQTKSGASSVLVDLNRSIK